MKAKINEIFYSLQLEGSYIGYPAVFVRFTGCNLDCDFCDTKYALHNGKLMDTDNILDYILQFNTNRIIFTGGEPALHDKFIANFMSMFTDFEYFIETNGTVFPKESIGNFKHVVVSPKFFALKKDVLKSFKQKSNSIEFKFLINSENDIKKTEKLSDLLNLYPVTLQPIYENNRPLSQYIKKTAVLIDAFKKSTLSKKDARLIIQNHKVIYKEKRGV